MNPFGFLLRWLDRRILRVVAEQRRSSLVETTRRVDADTLA